MIQIAELHYTELFAFKIQSKKGKCVFVYFSQEIRNVIETPKYLLHKVKELSQILDTVKRDFPQALRHRPLYYYAAVAS